MRSLLICHHDDPLDRIGLARWLASFTELAGIVVIDEPRDRMVRRTRRELKRVGYLRFLDVLAFRIWYRLAHAGRDGRWASDRLEALQRQFQAVADGTPVHETHSPNDAASEAFIRAARPDIVIARCKFILKERVFSIPAAGTFVLHPGFCPEYRNAHGCFWALAEDDLDRVGVTLLRVDRGVDTGPVFGYYPCEYDPVNETHAVIQYRCVLDNLDAIAKRLAAIHAGEAESIDTTGRESGEWGQPWLTRHLAWKHRARRRAG